MLVVSDTSPICNLAIINRLNLLELRHGKIIVPNAVKEELDHLTHQPARDNINAAIRIGWIEVRPNSPPANIPAHLDSGESAAIALAIEANAKLLLIDERRGRQAARSLGIKVAGILGELAHAKIVGRIGLLKPELDRLRTEAHFFIDHSIERFILSEVDER